jgi:hypothetical protein
MIGFTQRVLIFGTMLAALLGGYAFANALYLDAREGASGQYFVFAIILFALAVILFAGYYRLSHHRPSGEFLRRELTIYLMGLLAVGVVFVDVLLNGTILSYAAPFLILLGVVILAIWWLRRSPPEEAGLNG